jgi:hypothetical protein
VQSAVISRLPRNNVPPPGAQFLVVLPCDLQIRARVVSAEASDGGWIGWATQIGGNLADFRARGVPVTDLGEKFRIFDWQVVDR